MQNPASIALLNEFTANHSYEEILATGGAIVAQLGATRR